MRHHVAQTQRGLLHILFGMDEKQVDLEGPIFWFQAFVSTDLRDQEISEPKKSASLRESLPGV